MQSELLKELLESIHKIGSSIIEKYDCGFLMAQFDEEWERDMPILKDDFECMKNDFGRVCVGIPSNTWSLSKGINVVRYDYMSTYNLLKSISYIDAVYVFDTDYQIQQYITKEGNCFVMNSLKNYSTGKRIFLCETSDANKFQNVCNTINL
jgi:hypothetical protein